MAYILDKFIGYKGSGISNKQVSYPSNFNILKIKENISQNFRYSRSKEIKKSNKNFKPDFIFHLAAQALVTKSYEDPLNTIKTNAIGTLNLLES